ncbi:stage II sporulation protein D [Peptococcaceae bacterium 1198_IL3148]
MVTIRKAILGIILIAVAIIVLLPAINKSEQKAVTRHEIKIYHHASGQIETMPLEEYLIGVVAGEMPAEFPSEALKAQAVAARTYIAQRLLPGGVENPTHPGADICDDHRHGQAWLSKEQMKERWGTANYLHYYPKIKWAVQATENQVLTYNKQLITPVYHASCGGQGTENSGDVWQTDLPYLKSVSCPYCADPQPIRTVSYPLDKVAQRLQVDLNAIPAMANGAQQPIKITAKTSTGRPKTITIGEKQIPATTFRELLALRSTQFSYEIKNNQITFTTQGYGHAVGLCQYGAKGLAQHDKTYRQILAHYYPGTKIAKIK